MLRSDPWLADMAGKDAADVFATPEFWRTSRWPNQSSNQGSEFFDPNAKPEHPPAWTPEGSLTGDTPSDGFFKIPVELEPFITSQPDKETQHETPPEAPDDSDADATGLFSDAWLTTEETPPHHAEFMSWDGFNNPDVPPIAPLFLSEAGPAAYDAALHSAQDPLQAQNTEYNVVETDQYVASLLSLALGRASMFFTWDERKSSFAPELDQMRISGYSAQILRGMQDRCLQCGSTTRFLSIFVQVTYKALPSPGRVALAKAIDSLLVAVQAKLGAAARQIRSLLQLQRLVQPVHSLLAYFRALVSRLNRTRTDEHLLSRLFDEAQALEHGDGLLRDIMREILNRVTEPWADFAQKWIGTKSEGGNPMTKDGPSRSFVKAENVAFTDDFGQEIEEPDYILDESRMPKFIPKDVGRVMFETGRTLRLLRDQHPDHPICQMELLKSSEAPALEWHFEWTSIREIQSAVQAYEKSLSDAVRTGSPSHATAQQTTHRGGYELGLFGQPEGELAERLVASIKEMSQPLPQASETDKLARQIRDHLFENSERTETSSIALSPHWSLVPLLSFGPLVEAQARVINREYMKLVFGVHKLRDHLALQREFHLLGNGVFCSRISHALFDAELETAERQAGVARKGGAMGLRLGGRDTWPPASSELRLALMGVLSDCYSPHTKERSSGREGQAMPGDLSFAVRDLSEEQIVKCMNPDSLEALDFLRLSYKPPAPLTPIFTPVILVKYDRIFQMLLRLLRLLFVARELFRDTNSRTSFWRDADNASLRFRVEAQHFISCVVAYFFDTGVGLRWRQFEDWLNQVQLNVEDNGYGSDAPRVVSPDELREHHEQVLDRIMHTLLLRKRQQPVLGLLEDIFALVLKFAKHARQEGAEKSSASMATTSHDFYQSFKKKMDVFITVCYGLSEKGSPPGSKQARNHSIADDAKGGAIKEENTIEQLLLQLEMSGYYGGVR